MDCADRSTVPTRPVDLFGWMIRCSNNCVLKKRRKAKKEVGEEAKVPKLERMRG